jgi:hypothetical protein
MDTLKFTILLDKRDVEVQYESQISDFYITIPLQKDSRLAGDYVDIFFDPRKETINRQLINPFYMELGIFENIKNLSDNYIIFEDTFFRNGKTGFKTKTKHSFKINDYIIVDKNLKNLNPQYDGNHKIVDILDDFSIVTSIPYGKDSIRESGKLYFLSNSNIKNSDIEDSVYKKAKQYGIAIRTIQDEDAEV